jgi:presequence protease
MVGLRLGLIGRQVKEIPEFELVASQLFHDKTGAEHLHISREDKNNVFAIGFGTPSMNSTGVAHILVRLNRKTSNL